MKPNPIIKAQCKDRLNACVCLNGTTTVSRVLLEHCFSYSKNLKPHIKRRLELNDQARTNVSRNFQSLVVEANGYKNLTFGEKMVETI